MAMYKATVGVVEDNDTMRKAIVDSLKSHNYTVFSADRAETVLENRMYEQSDIMIIDISLPGISGYELTQEIRKQGYDGGIIAVTARDTVEDKLLGLDRGMNDYIVKPFDMRELIARINVQLRAVNQHHDFSPIHTKRFYIDPKQYRFKMDDKVIKLTLVEFRLMRKLMKQHFTTVTNVDLIEAAWGEDVVTSNPPLRIHIANIRHKIKDTTFTILRTVPGVGYILYD